VTFGRRGADQFGADIGGAISALNTLKQAVTGAAEPVTRLKNAFVEAGAAVQHSGAAAVAAFRADIAANWSPSARISLREAFGFDLEYTASAPPRSAPISRRFSPATRRPSPRNPKSYRELVELSARYEAELAQDQRRIAEAARRETDKMAQPYRQAFDAIGAGWRSVVIGLVEGTLSFRSAALGVVQSVERGFIGMAETTLSRAAAGPLVVAARAWLSRPSARGSATCSATRPAGGSSAPPATARRGGRIDREHRRACRQYHSARRDDRRARGFRRGRGAGASAAPLRWPAAPPSSARPRAAGGIFRAPRQPFRLQGRRHRALGGARLGVAEFCRLDRGPCCTPARWCCRRRSARACRA